MTIKVEAINNNNKRQGCFVPLVRNAAIGAAGAYALKYIQPLNYEEVNTPEYKNAMHEIEKKRTSYTAWTQSYLDKLKRKGNLSLAEDTFIKTFDGLKEGEKVGQNRLVKAFWSVKNQNPEEVGELKRLFSEAKFEASKVAQKYVNMYNLATKHFRPTYFFLMSGAVVGAFITLAHEVLKTDVRKS